MSTHLRIPKPHHIPQQESNGICNLGDESNKLIAYRMLWAREHGHKQCICDSGTWSLHLVNVESHLARGIEVPTCKPPSTIYH